MAIFVLDLIPATPNLNGNSESSLLAQLAALMTDLKHARGALSLCSDHWHGRNFLPQGSTEAGIMRRAAEDAWRLRMDAIDSMYEEVLTLALQIQGGGAKPEPVRPEDVPVGWESVEGGAKPADAWDGVPSLSAEDMNKWAKAGKMEMQSSDEAIERIERDLFEGDDDEA